MTTFNCKFAIFESQQAIILLELMAVLMMVALLASSWASFYIQLRLAERRVVVQLEALHLAASYLDQLRARNRWPENKIDTVGRYHISCVITKIAQCDYLWIAEVTVSHELLGKNPISLMTCGRVA